MTAVKMIHMPETHGGFFGSTKKRKAGKPTIESNNNNDNKK